VQLPEADLLPTTLAALPAPQQLQLPRVSASKLQLPLQLPQGREIQLPPSSGVKLPRLERLAECKQASAASSPGSTSAAALSLAEAAAHAALSRMLYSAGIVPTKDHQELAEKLISEGIADPRDLQSCLSDDPRLLDSIRMKVAQQSCLNRYLSSLPAASSGAAPAPADPEAAALANIKSFLAAAGVVPVSHYDNIALQLIEEGVADEVSLHDSLRCVPPAFDLKSLGIKSAQVSTIIRYFEMVLKHKFNPTKMAHVPSPFSREMNKFQMPETTSSQAFSVTDIEFAQTLLFEVFVAAQVYFIFQIREEPRS
jgi:hypothetical protein